MGRSPRSTLRAPILAHMQIHILLTTSADCPAVPRGAARGLAMTCASARRADDDRVPLVSFHASLPWRTPIVALALAAGYAGRDAPPLCACSSRSARRTGRLSTATARTTAGRPSRDAWNATGGLSMRSLAARGSPGARRTDGVKRSRERCGRSTACRATRTEPRTSHVSKGGSRTIPERGPAGTPIPGMD